MTHCFITYLLNDDDTPKTSTINGSKDILVVGEKNIYTYEEIDTVVELNFYLRRSQYGWEVRFIDVDGMKKELFIRSSHIHSSNDTTANNQTIKQWIDHVYERDTKQIGLF